MEQANFKPDMITIAEHLLEFQDEFFDLLAAGIGVTFILARKLESTLFQHPDRGLVIFSGPGIERAI